MLISSHTLDPPLLTTIIKITYYLDYFMAAEITASGSSSTALKNGVSIVSH